jgi:hypothetical protein
LLLLLLLSSTMLMLMFLHYLPLMFLHSFALPLLFLHSALLIRHLMEVNGGGSAAKAPDMDSAEEEEEEEEEEELDPKPVKDTEGPWMFEIPEEHAIPPPDDYDNDDEDWDGTDSVAIELKDGTFVVVPRDWYDDAADYLDDEDYVANMVGTVTDTTYPDEGDELTGTFIPKMGG